VVSVFKTVGAVAAVAIDCAVVTQDACAESTISAGKKAANIRTDNAANVRRSFKYSPRNVDVPYKFLLNQIYVGLRFLISCVFPEPVPELTDSPCTPLPEPFQETMLGSATDL
jgi:hypothetical protein